MERYDAVIIGSGPAGLAAAINLKIRNKRFLIFGHEKLSHKLLSAKRIDNFLGLPEISGPELHSRFVDHLKKMDITILPEQVQMIYPMGDFFSMATSQNTYEADAVILATGVSHAKPLPGEETFLGRGVGYCATCDAPLYRGKTVTILGYTDEAVHEANYVAELAAKTLYIPMAKTDIMPSAPVEVLSGKATAIEGDTVVERVIVDGAAVATDGVFILRETVAPSALMPGIALDGGHIAVDVHMQTSIPGCYAAGDCTGKPHQFMRAVGQGQTAALNLVTYLDNKRQAAKVEN